MHMPFDLQAYHDSSIPTYTGWMFPSESCINKLGVMAFNCLHGQAPDPYLVDYCANQLQMSRTGRDNISDPPPDS